MYNGGIKIQVGEVEVEEEEEEGEEVQMASII